MKTTREMTDSVLHKATQVAARQQRTRKRAAGLIAGILCVMLIAGFTFIPRGAEQPTPTAPPTLHEDISIQTGKVYFLSNPGTADMLTPLKTDMTYAVDQVIRVFPKNSKAAAEEFLTAWRAKYAGVVFEGGRTIFETKNTIIYSLSAGVTSVILPDYTQILKVERESTGVLVCGGTYAEFNNDYTLKYGDHTVTIPGGSYRVHMHFVPSQETMKRLDSNPETPLSTIRDTFTLTIYYKNGTTETLKLDVSLNNEGQIYISSCRTSTM